MLAEESSSSSDSCSGLIPHSIYFMVWTQLPPPRANPLDASRRRWMIESQPFIRPFSAPPPSREDFFRDSLIAPVVYRDKVLLFQCCQYSISYHRTITSTLAADSW
ncbi:protein Daple isoform X2 [Sesbania bispinosa]|nr:protein Daple isoform X2 [Sesbania bispinosa]